MNSRLIQNNNGKRTCHCHSLCIELTLKVDFSYHPRLQLSDNETQFFQFQSARLQKDTMLLAGGRNVKVFDFVLTFSDLI